jgi:hypothetical protein
MCLLKFIYGRCGEVEILGHTVCTTWTWQSIDKFLSKGFPEYALPWVNMSPCCRVFFLSENFEMASYILFNLHISDFKAIVQQV